MTQVPSPPLTAASEFIAGDWPRSYFLSDPHIDNLMSALLHMGAEHWALRRRMLVVEKFLRESDSIDGAAIEAYTPTADERAAWDGERDAFIDRVFGVLIRETHPKAGHGRFDPAQWAGFARQHQGESA